MNKQDLHDYLHTEKNTDIQIHNEIFNDFSHIKFKTWKHRGFAYAYYYLVTYIYRNALYGIREPEEYSQKSIIDILIRNHTSISYIVKRNGLLDKSNYLKTTRNYPTVYYMDDEILEFATIENWRDMNALKPNVSTSFFIKKPVKAFNRYDEDFSGTFYSYQNTHRIPIFRFISIITNEKLGYVGLYIYAYLSMMNDKFVNGFQISNRDLADAIGCASERTISKYTTQLESLGYIKSTRKIIDHYKLLEKVYTVNE